MSVFSSLKPKAHLNKEYFDLGHRDVLSLKVGALTPVLVEDTIPNGEYSCDVLSLLRSDAIQSTPFTRIKLNTEYYFVPYSQIYRDFERLYYQRGEEQRNHANRSSSNFQVTKLPTFNLGNLLHDIFLEFIYDYVLECIYDNVQDVQHILYHNLYDYYVRGAIWDCIDVHGRFCPQDFLRNLDLLGYGNFLPVMKFFLPDIDINSQAMSQIIHDSTQDRSTFDASVQSEYAQNIGDFDEWLQSNLGDKSPNVLRLAAYLKVWSDFYRNSQYDVSQNYAYYFNFDYIYQDGQTNIETSKIFNLLRPRYRQYKKDMFTGGYPTAQFGSVAVAELNNPVSISNDIIPSSSQNVVVQGSSSPKPGKLSYLGNVESANNWNVQSSVSALAMREALAMQRYRERILRAGNRLTALQTALFGDNSRYLMDEYCDFIGSVDSSVDFNTVSATAATDGAELGEMASNGISTFNGKAFNYKSHDFGVIIGLAYVLPEADYEAYGIDPMCTKSTSFDFYKPDFQNLGLDPVYNYLLNMQSYLGSGGSRSDAVWTYLAKYFEYKTRVDKVHGEFYTHYPFAVTGTEPVAGDLILSRAKGAFVEYVSTRQIGYEQLQLSNLYVSPEDIDSIFYTKSDSFQASDKFKLNIYHALKAYLPMSVVGLPQ